MTTNEGLARELVIKSFGLEQRREIAALRAVWHEYSYCEKRQKLESAVEDQGLNFSFPQSPFIEETVFWMGLVQMDDGTMSWSEIEEALDLLDQRLDAALAKIQHPQPPESQL
jgi:hypothetical protein